MLLPILNSILLSNDFITIVKFNKKLKRVEILKEKTMKTLNRKKGRKKISSLVLILLVTILLIVSYGVASASTNEVSTSKVEQQEVFPVFFIAPIASFITLLFALFLAINLLKKEEGNASMKEISKAIREGADAYLRKQYKTISIFIIIVFALLILLAFVVPEQFNFAQPFAYLTGIFYSALAGFVGMKIATRANSRTANAAKESLNGGLRIAFNAGTIMGMSVVGFGLLDLSFWYIIGKFALGFTNLQITQTMLTISMGASSMALFARVGGGIFTKAADVGADLVGKVEAGIPEDDPRNPATIADNVGDNVGDVAGMGADLYESYIGSILATMALGFSAFSSFILPNGGGALSFGFEAETIAMMLPLIIAGLGMLFSIIGTFLVRAKGEDTKSLLKTLRKGTWSSTIMIITATFFLTWLLFGFEIGFGLFLSVVIGLVAGNIIAYFTEYYTSDEYNPTQKLSGESETGPATIIIGGISLGMKSTAIPIITIATATVGSFFVSGGFGHSLIGGIELFNNESILSLGLPLGLPFGLFGIGITAVGMLSTLGITLATDAYGPVADNAGGIAEMSRLEPYVRKRTDLLDSLGNTTAATGKGFAIGSAGLTTLALIATFSDKLEQIIGNKPIFNMSDPLIIVGLFIGAILPFVFSAMTMGAVGRAASMMVKEVRRQFREKPGILNNKDKPDYKRCVEISTAGAQREMVAPSIVAVATPIIVGFLLGPGSVVAMLSGALVSGFALAVMMANSGGAWDNAKKYIEAGHHGGKGSTQHKAAVVGDTVGDPFKDTSGPSINILLKLMSIVSIVFVPAMYIINELLKGLF